MNKHTKILAICEAGMVRSTAFLTELKWNRGYKDVLNCGVATNSLATLLMLGRWADRIYVTADRSVWRQIPETLKAKATFVNIGKDIWRNPSDPRLKQIVKKAADKLKL